MTLTVPTIRPISKADVIAFRGSPYKESFRGIAAELDGKILGIAGVLHTHPLQAFSEMSEEMRKYPKQIVKAAFQFRDILDAYESPIFAIASPDEKNSSGFLKHVGFEQYKDEVYRWLIRLHG